MPDLSGLGWVYAGLVAVGLLRGQATYWIARGVVSGVARRTHASGNDARWRRRLATPAMARGRELLRRHGWPVIPLCYLTVGVQTVVLASAGALRMPWGRFTAAQIPGVLAWAGIYSTLGFAAWMLLARQAALSWQLWAGLLVVAAVGLVARRAWLSRQP